MKRKKQIIERFLPIAALEALTAEAADAVPQPQLLQGLVAVRQVPFRVGRESRVKKVNGRLERIERPKMDDREPNNDLYLVDHGQLLNISREHLLIDVVGSSFVLVDRGSACGTKINDEPIGGEDQGGTRSLNDGDIITVGTMDSPYRYRFHDLRGFVVSLGPGT